MVRENFNESFKCFIVKIKKKINKLFNLIYQRIKDRIKEIKR